MNDKLNIIEFDKFICAANRCSPIPVVQHAVPDTYLAVQGSVVQYTCIDGFSASSHLSTTCDGINWMPSQLSGCEGAIRLVIMLNIVISLCGMLYMFYASVFLGSTVATVVS